MKLKDVYIFIRDEIPELLRNYRVLPVSMVGFLSYLLYEYSMYVMAEPYIKMQEWQIAPIVGGIGAILAGLFGVIKMIDLNSSPKRGDREGM